MGPSRKKIENPKIGCMFFFVLLYLEPISTHTTSNFFIYRYIYNKSSYGHPIGDTEVGLLRKKIENRVCVCFCFAIY